MAAQSGVIEFHASSGSPTHPRQIVSLLPNSGQDYNRLGMFGAGGPGTFVLLSQYQDTTYIVNEDGNPSGAWAASGKLSNNKFVNTSSVNPNSSGSIAVSALTPIDATFRVRFTEPSGNAVQTQNVFLQVVKLNASSGVEVGTVVSGINIYAFEVGQASAWTLLSQSALSGSLALTSRGTAKIIHDYHIAVSCSPLAVGIKRDYGFVFIVEFL